MVVIFLLSCFEVLLYTQIGGITTPIIIGRGILFPQIPVPIVAYLDFVLQEGLLSVHIGAVRFSLTFPQI